MSNFKIANAGTIKKMSTNWDILFIRGKEENLLIGRKKRCYIKWGGGSLSSSYGHFHTAGNDLSAREAVS